METKTISVPVYEYGEVGGIRYDYSDEDRMFVEVSGKYVVIRANKEGLETLARIALTLAQDEVTVGAHVHLDPGFGSGLQKGSSMVIIERIG